MPNDIKNTITSSVISTGDSNKPSNKSSGKSSRISQSSGTATVWILSGVVLAACSTSSGDDGGASGYSVDVVDGPVAGAAIFFDVDGDGTVSEAEKQHADNVDENGNPRFTTDVNGKAVIPTEYQGRIFVADVDGAVDTATGEVLKGTFTSNSDGTIASPITDLINERIQEDDSLTEQDILDEIFGEGEVTPEDIENPDNYVVQEQIDPLDGGATEATKKEEITKVAIILTEIKEEEAEDTPDLTKVGASSATEFSAEDKITVVKIFIDNDPTNDNTHSDLEKRIDDREDAGREILGGKPVAAPSRKAEVFEGESFNVADFADGAEVLFGFLDPAGNGEGVAASNFAGIWLDTNSVTNASITLNGDPINANVLATGETNAPTEITVNGTAITVNFDDDSAVAWDANIVGTNGALTDLTDLASIFGDNLSAVGESDLPTSFDIV